MAKVAFVGLGVMGYPMAGHLRSKGGHDVTVYNRTTAKAEQPPLFELLEDCRPASERSAAGRYSEPSLFSRIGRLQGGEAQRRDDSPPLPFPLFPTQATGLTLARR